MFVISSVTGFPVLLIISTSCMASHLCTKNVYITLNENGSLAGESEVPECPPGRRIKLLSYKYYKRLCDPMCINQEFGELSKEAVINLHDACSFKAQCANMLFPLTDMIKFNAMHVDYKCEDLNYNFFDICSDDKRLVKTEENIILNRTGQHLEECRCFIHGEKFSISVNDLRLQSKLDANCSLSTVSIQSTKFSCEHEEVPVFKKEIEHLLQRAFVAVTLNGTDAVPQMIWLTLIPNDDTTALISCNTKAILTSSITTILEDQYLTTMTKKKGRAKDEVSGKIEIDTIIPVGAASMVIVLVVLFYVRHKSRLSIRKHDDINLEEIVDDNVVPSHSVSDNAVGLMPTEIRNSKGRTEASEEKMQTENFYSCVDGNFCSKTIDSETEMYFDTANQVQRICHSEDYHHLSEISNFSFWRRGGSLLNRQVETTYSVAKCVDQHLNEEQLYTP